MIFLRYIKPLHLSLKGGRKSVRSRTHIDIYWTGFCQTTIFAILLQSYKSCTVEIIVAVKSQNLTIGICEDWNKIESKTFYFFWKCAWGIRHSGGPSHLTTDKCVFLFLAECLSCILGISSNFHPHCHQSQVKFQRSRSSDERKLNHQEAHAKARQQLVRFIFFKIRLLTEQTINWADY